MPVDVVDSGSKNAIRLVSVDVGVVDWDSNSANRTGVPIEPLDVTVVNWDSNNANRYNGLGFLQY